MKPFHILEDMIVASAEAVRPPERITVSEAAERYHIVNNPGSHVGPFSLTKTPYLVEPMNVLTSLDYTAMIFVGPARTGKSAMALNWLCHTVVTDPADMMFVHMAQHTARTWSKSDLDKLIRHSPEIRKRLAPGRQNDNTFDKLFLSGMRLEVTWPTITNLSGKTVPRTWNFDYDREPINIDGEGSKFGLTKKRTQTYKRYGMSVAESSPGFPITNPRWMPETPHEAPPCEGILGLYNTGDRRRWYWQCPQCRASFEPSFKLLHYPDSADAMDAAEQVTLVCPHDGFPMVPAMQEELNAGGRWVRDGQVWLPDNTIVGTAVRSPTASFWMKGPAAAFTTWVDLVYKHLLAEREYDRTGSEEDLKTTVTVDQGEPFTSKSIEGGRLPEELKNRARPARRGYVPEGVRFLMTTIDVQAGGRPSFVCHTYGIEPVRRVDGAWAFDINHIDMWKIRKSRRLDQDGERHLLDPASYPEDWDILIDEAIERVYPLDDDSGRMMQVKLIACDSGGAASERSRKKSQAPDGPTVSVTANAYEFWRRLRDDPEGRGHHKRFHLLKGQPSRTAPRLHMTMPDSRQKDKYAIARGDVPVWFVNSDIVKDQVSSKLGRTDPGGQIIFPVWHDENGDPVDIDWLYTQLTSEVRTPSGWEKPSRRKNEAFDLLAYCVAFGLHPDIRIEMMNWDNPPAWAAPHSTNSMVFLPQADGKRPIEADQGSPKRSLKDLGGLLA